MEITKNIPVTITINDNNHCNMFCDYYECSDYAGGELCHLYSSFLRSKKRCNECINDFGSE